MEALQRLHNRGSISTGYDIDNSLKFEEDNLEAVYAHQLLMVTKEHGLLVCGLKEQKLLLQVIITP